MNYRPIIEASREEMLREIGQRRNEGTLSNVHDETHCEAVARYGGATARALMEGQGYNDLADRASAITQIAGYLHDVKREATETEPHGPVSATYFEDLIKDTPFRDLDPSDKIVVHRAISDHELNFAQVVDKWRNPIGQKNLTSTVTHGILTGDKALEASGYRVLERRSFFTGRERIESGDLSGIFKYPMESHLSVLGETMIRLYGRNPIDTYPDWLKPFAQGWHAVQYQLYKGLLDYTGMSEEQAVRFFMEKGFPKFDQKVGDTVSSQRHLDGQFFSAEQYPVLHDEIESLKMMDQILSDKLAQASFDVVMAIAKSKSPEHAIRDYQGSHILVPRNVWYKSFFDGIIAYREGSTAFLQSFEDSVRGEVERISKK